MDLNIYDSLPLAPRTIESYRSNARQINKHLKNSKLGFSKMKRIITILSNDNPNVAGNFNSAVKKYIQVTDSGNSKLIEKYTKEIRRLNGLHFEKRNELPKEIKKLDYPKLKQEFLDKLKNKKYKNLSLMEFILSLYLLKPPRRSDYSNMIYTTSKDNVLNSEHNYLYHKNRSFIFYFNSFKNVSTIGNQKFNLAIKGDKILRKIITNRKFKDGDFIYPKQRRQFSRDLNDITKEVFGQKFGINGLRKLHNSHKFAGVVTDDIEEDAKFMSHSVATKIKFYVNKID